MQKLIVTFRMHVPVFLTALIILLATLSCERSSRKHIPAEVQRVLDSAGDNRGELERVIDHYAKDSDTLKLAAAYFLIRNMPRHYSYQGHSLEAFDLIFGQVERHEKKRPLRGNIHFPLINSWADSIIGVHGFPHPESLRKVYDHQTISAKMLIENIDCAFEAWRFPWADHLTFDQFCNYILPYRFQDESLESWRLLYMERFQWLLDSMQNRSDPVEACRLINNDIKEWFRFNEELSLYPSAISPLNLLKARMGRCLDQAGIANFAMRAMGIPVVHEVIPQWGDRSMGHDFSAVLGKDGKFIGFLGGELGPGENEIRNKAPKIYRQMYSVTRPELSAFDDGLSAVLGRQFGTDATDAYISTTDVIIPKNGGMIENVFLAVFDNSKWVPISMARDTANGYLFEKMGRGIVYLPCTINDYSIIPVSAPLYVDSLGRVETIRPEEKTRTVRLERKYPMTKIKMWWMTLMGKGRFEGANKPDFSDSRTIFVIPDTIALAYHISELKMREKFRFVRYFFPEDCFGSLGELAFYEPDSSLPLKGVPIKAAAIKNDDLLVAFDGKWDRFIHTSLKGDYNEMWVGLDLGSPKLISHVGYSPRNDRNNIEKGMEYELFYWNDEWHSLGRKIGTGDHLIYSSIPAGALLLLRNHTEGKEERIFLYENGKQIWF